MYGTVLCYAAAVRARMGDYANAARDLAEGVERTHKDGNRPLFYVGIWSGIEILGGLARHAETAVFEGIASAVPTDYRDAPGFASIHDAIARARAALGPEPYDAALATGAAMSFDEAVEHVVHTLDELVNDTEVNGLN